MSLPRSLYPHLKRVLRETFSLSLTPRQVEALLNLDDDRRQRRKGSLPPGIYAQLRGRKLVRGTGEMKTARGFGGMVAGHGCVLTTLGRDVAKVLVRAGASFYEERMGK
jgi:hypothetical protein